MAVPVNTPDFAVVKMLRVINCYYGGYINLRWYGTSVNIINVD